MMIFYMNPLLIAAAAVPAIILLIKVYNADKVEHEPPGVLISLMIYGIVAALIAIFTERLGILILKSIVPPYTVFYNVLLYFIVVAFSEEGFKYLLLKRRTWREPAFNYQFDAVVYAVFLSLGFAMWENMGYVAMYGLSTALVRAVTAIPGHACFGVFMGMWYGFGKKYDNERNERASKAYRIMSFLLPAFIHGCYDFAAAMEGDAYAWIFIAFILIMFIIAFRLIKKLSYNDRYIGREYHPLI